jgi:putative membrane protein
MKRILLTLTCAWMIASSPALAQYSKPAAAAPDTSAEGGTSPFELSPTARPTTPDSAFVAAAAQSGFYGQAMGRLAGTRASSPEVKRLAREIAETGARMSEDLKPLMKAQRVAAPTGLDRRQKAAHDWLEKLSGQEFDRAFVSNMRATRASDVMVFQRAADRAHDAGLREWAAKALPILADQQASIDRMK